MINENYGFKGVFLYAHSRRKRFEDLKTIGGAPSPTPLHPHPSQVPPVAQVGGGGKPSNIGTPDRTPGAAWHRPPVSRTGGRRVTTGATGGGRQLNDKRTERRQEEERDARAVNFSGDMELRQENLGGGREGGPEPAVESST